MSFQLTLVLPQAVSRCVCVCEQVCVCVCVCVCVHECKATQHLIASVLRAYM